MFFRREKNKHNGASYLFSFTYYLFIPYFLREKNIHVHIVEARVRLGGKIYTKYSEYAACGMGATWVATGHIALMALLKDLNIGHSNKNWASLPFANPSRPTRINYWSLF